ncbi:hypothetical protein ACOSP7_023406 [Xanthoceras sorbifolium]
MSHKHCFPSCSVTSGSSVWQLLWRLVHENITLPSCDVFAWAAAFVDEFDAANSEIGPPNKAVLRHSWVPPDEGWYKLNVDASLKSKDCLVGVGAVIRDSKGLFMAGLSRKFVGTVSIEVAEATALLNGLHLAIESVGLIISDILTLSARVDVKFFFVPRMANFVAHSLARFSFSISDVCIWLEDAPSWLNQGLLSDFHA